MRLRRKSVGVLCVLALAGACVVGRGIRAASAGPLPYPIPASPPYVVALDAGHGGTDTGAHSAQMEESEACEQTVDALFALLEADERFVPVRTRENGQGCRIKERVARAADAKAALLLSIHFNSDPSCPDAYGFECFPTPPGRPHSRASLVLARQIAAQMQQAGHRLRGAEGVRFAYYSGKKKLIVDATDTRQRSLKSFAIVEDAPCPAVLAEQAFLTNSADRAAWTGPQGSQKAAQAYYQALCAYFGMEPLAQNGQSG